MQIIEHTFQDTSVKWPDVGNQKLNDIHSNGRFYDQGFLEYLQLLQLTGTYFFLGFGSIDASVFSALLTPANRVLCLAQTSHHYDYISNAHNANGICDKANALMSTDIQIESAEKIKGATNVMRMDSADLTGPLSTQLLEWIDEYEPLIYCRLQQAADLSTFDTSIVDGFLNAKGYKKTGRIFGYQPTVEYAKQQQIDEHIDHRFEAISLPIDKYKSSHLAATPAKEDGGSILIHLDACPKAYLASTLDFFEVPAFRPADKINIAPAQNLFLDVEAYPVGTASFSIIVNIYDERELIRQDRHFVNRRKFCAIVPPPQASSARIIVDCKGTGYLNFKKINILRTSN